MEQCHPASARLTSHFEEEVPESEQAFLKWQKDTKHFVSLEQNLVCRIHLVKEFMLTEQAIYSKSP